MVDDVAQSATEISLFNEDESLIDSSDARHSEAEGGVFVYIYIYMCVCVCVHVCMYVCVCVCFVKYSRAYTTLQRAEQKQTSKRPLSSES